MKVSFSFSPTRAAVVLTLLACFLTLLSVIAHALQYLYGSGHFTDAVRQFNISDEGNVPTWFKSMLLLGCAGLLGVVAAGKKGQHDRYARHWLALSFVFMFLSIDELSQIHEALEEPISALRHTGGAFLYVAWGLPVFMMALVVAVAYMRFLAALPVRTRLLFVASGVVYVTGALGVDQFNTWLYDNYYNLVLVRGFFAMLEEWLQMIGSIMFIYTLMAYLQAHALELQVKALSPAEALQEAESLLIRGQEQERTPMQPATVHSRRSSFHMDKKK